MPVKEISERVSITINNIRINVAFQVWKWYAQYEFGDDFRSAGRNCRLISLGSAANEHESAMKSRLYGYACPRCR